MQRAKNASAAYAGTLSPGDAGDSKRVYYRPANAEFLVIHVGAKIERPTSSGLPPTTPAVSTHVQPEHRQSRCMSPTAVPPREADAGPVTVTSSRGNIMPRSPSWPVALLGVVLGVPVCVPEAARR